MLARPVTRQSLACIRCGACLNACPVYQQIGGHAYGSVYPGPIGAVITPQLFGLRKAAQLPYASSLCGACREVCPVKIDIPALLLHLRTQITEGPKQEGIGAEQEAKPRRLEGLAFKLWAAVMMRPRWYELSGRLLRALQGLVVRDGKIGMVDGVLRKMFPPLAAWTSARDLRPIESQTFREQWRQTNGRSSNS
jgi:L-lactate dehydrogenase complex protein LldF